ncbi:hypothetical protein [Sphingobium sp. B2D3C]|uniref:hypothetical protein n=1 Tax=Sphingobium sp. B2D3C TaxID=2940581 RepID=UPI002224C20D|nr:hypothetical protein [Sphingobium sp. B2D3C]MCW2399656.1 hypothetical protein [Sphingobium sp. B2D3C]
MTAYYSARYDEPQRVGGKRQPTKMADLKFCDGNLTVAFFNGMTYDSFREDVEKGRLIDNKGNAFTARLADISHTVNLEYIANADVNYYWDAPPKPSQPQLASSPRANNAPVPLNAMLAASLAEAFARAPRIQIGMSMGMAKLSKNEVVVDIGIQTQEYVFDVRPDARCTPVGAKQRCTYAFMITGNGSFVGGKLPTQTTGWVTRTDVFDRKGASYRSAATDQLMLQAATPPEGPARPDRPIKQAPTIGCDAGIVWLCKY